ncbi:MAG: class D sortase [Oscillospiraceae bacterium]|nr:class D sortase [Oscillospiraceae bacterium]
MKQYLKSLLLFFLLTALCVSQASALEYSVDAPEDYLFAVPTSQDIILQEESVNVNPSKTAALAAPGFRTATSYLPGSGEHLTPNLAPGGMAGSLVNAVGNADYSSLPSTEAPAVPGNNMTWSIGPTQWEESASVGFTDVTDDLYYKDGTLGTLEIPAIGLEVSIVQGTDSAALAKGAGHFEDTSIWSGNICVAAHNRGTNSYFGKIHTLDIGDEITLTTKLGTRTYAVTGVEKISETDNSGTASTSDNRLTLFTCVRDEREYRWCVTAGEVV